MLRIASIISLGLCLPQGAAGEAVSVSLRPMMRPAAKLAAPAATPVPQQLPQASSAQQGQEAGSAPISVAAVIAPPPSRLAPRPLGSALRLASAGRWADAVELSKRADPHGPDLIEWVRLRAGQGSAEETLVFLEKHGDWPGLEYLRKRAEPAFEMADDAQVLAFFGSVGPQTGAGVLRYAQALIAAGQAAKAEALVTDAWRSFDLGTRDHERFLERHGAWLAPHHGARLRMALWRGLEGDAALMEPLVPAPDWGLAKARQAVQSGAAGADAMIAALPLAQRGDAGLAYDRFRQIMKSGTAEEAAALMLARSEIAGGLDLPERWASERRSLARQLMRGGQTQLAYQLAAQHQLSEGANYADLEWLAGYLALRYMDKPAVALEHFDRFRAAVETPISLGRAGYWIGRAAEALGDTQRAARGYVLGAQHQTSFYGLLAAERAGLPVDSDLAGDEIFADWRRAEFLQRPVARVARAALEAGEIGLAERFYTHLAESLDRTQIGQMGAMLEAMNRPHLQVMVGKRSAREGHVLPGPYYALHEMRYMDLPVAKEMALAIARRESEFDPRVRSGVGAQGLMQLMPATAKEVAQGLGLAYDARRLGQDWRYNAVLGSEYLSQMAARFDGNVIMISAAYNAGPSRPIRWMEEFGNPLEGEIDMIDWIEHIPFRETRNYVMRVAESLPVYRARLGGDALPMPFSAEISGHSLRPPSE